jgi:hypothetical protein
MDAMTQLVTLAGLAAIVRNLAQRLEKVTGRPVELDTGTAVLIAADAAFRETGERDLTLAFSTEVAGAFTPEDMSGNVEGFAVGFRDDASIRLVLMDHFGEHLSVRLVPVPWASQRGK